MATTPTVRCLSRPAPVRTRFRFRPATSRRLSFVAVEECVGCGRSIVVRYGEVVATFSVGNELVGLCCDACLSDDSRQRLAALRGAAGREGDDGG